MDFFKSIKDFLGLSIPQGHSKDEESQRNQFFSAPHEFSGNRHENNDVILDEQSPRHFNPRGFSVFSDPLEMHRYFEHQMNEMLKSFGFQQFDDGQSIFHSFSVPAIDGRHIDEERPQSSDDIRSQYLKPGYEEPSSRYQNRKKLDTDVDGKLNKKDLDSLFGGHSKETTPFESKPSTRTFGQSVTTKTVQHPDGSIETHRTVRDNDGNEETTITKRLGNQEYSVTKRRNKNGEEENVENLVNIDEKDLEMFKKLHSNQVLGDAENKPPNWFPFDKFFK